MSSQIPADDPPPYSASAQAPSSSSTGARPAVGKKINTASSSSFLHPNRARNGIPPADRRSMEDEARPLPDGWVRQYDAKSAHQFFVDTRANPPRSIWHHPYDDEDYLSTLTSEERERIQEMDKFPYMADIVAESSDDDADHHATSSSAKGKTAAAATATSSAAASSSNSHKSFGRKMKDKLTNSTHEERELQRKKRAEAERKQYELHMAFRRAMQRAMQTGQPEYLGRDPQGKDVYVEPPGGPAAGYAPDGRMINPYSQGPYTNPNARFITPPAPYQRPYGYGYGGGMGMMPLAGGLMGGMLLGGLLF